MTFAAPGGSPGHAHRTPSRCPDPADVPGLTANARELLRQLDKLTAKKHAECWFSAERLADAIGCCAATVRSGLRLLEAVGLVRIVRDYSLKVRRRIVLLWRAGDPSMAQDVCPQSPQTFCATNGSPLHPPYKDPEGKQLTTTIEGPDRSSSSVSSSSGPQSGPETGATSNAEVDQVVAKAVEVLGPECEARTRRLAEQSEPAFVAKALDVIKPKLRTLSNPWGYLKGIVANFEAEGAPVERPRPQPIDREAELARLMAMLGEPGDGPR